uniref:CX domain-containing protein n=1 Tax=Caenorhabditis tropicalis TaxID=1561998 RepID=A0A1I7U5Q4_9PELO
MQEELSQITNNTNLAYEIGLSSNNGTLHETTMEVPEDINVLEFIYNSDENGTLESDIWNLNFSETYFHSTGSLQVVGNLPCGKGRCLIDNTRSEYKATIEQWSFGLVLIGVFFFLLISGAADAIVKWVKNRGRKEEPYNTLELIDMSKRT